MPLFTEIKRITVLVYTHKVILKTGTKETSLADLSIYEWKTCNVNNVRQPEIANQSDYYLKHQHHGCVLVYRYAEGITIVLLSLRTFVQLLNIAGSFVSVLVKRYTRTEPRSPSVYILGNVIKNWIIRQCNSRVFIDIQARRQVLRILIWVL